MVLILITAFIIFYFTLVPRNVSSFACSFATGIYCQYFVFNSNATLSEAALLLTNTQPFPIAYPQIEINLRTSSRVTGKCNPAVVRQGGSIICNATFTINATPVGGTVSGDIFLSAIPCATLNLTKCKSGQRQTYAGSFSATTSLLVNQTPVTLSIIIQNTSQAANGKDDVITASVRLLGTPLAGAPIVFTESNSFASLSPTSVTTGYNGSATSFISSQTRGSTIVTAAFANLTANAIVAFVTPTYFTVQTGTATNSSSTNGTIANSTVCSLQNANSTAVIIDSQSYTCSQLPVSFGYKSYSQHAYTCISPLAGAIGTRYIFQSIAGCGVSGQSGIFTTGAPGSNCTMSCTYSTQYYLAEFTSPATGVTVGPGSGWFTPGSNITISTNASRNLRFLNWTGEGLGSYSGTSTTSTVVVDAPITEQANFQTTTSTSISTTTTSQSTTTIKYYYNSTTLTKTLPVNLGLNKTGSLFLCAAGGGSVLTSYSWTLDKKDNAGYAELGHQTSRICTANLPKGSSLSLGGLSLVSPSAYTLYSGSCSVRLCSLEQYYNVNNPAGATVFILASCGGSQCSSISIPAGCSQIFLTNAGSAFPGATSYAAVCSAQSTGSYKVTVNLGGANGGAALGIYVFPS